MTQQLFAKKISTPLGHVWGVVDEAGALLELEFEEDRFGIKEKRDVEARHASKGRTLVWDEERFDHVERALERYFAREARDFDVALAPEGTPFQKKVWDALLEIPYGTTWSYGELARHIGQPRASRAVGLANGRNPIPIIIPCHRVVGANGTLTGYGGGLEKKQALLALERGQAVFAG